MIDPECIEFIGEREYLKQTMNEHHNQNRQEDLERCSGNQEGHGVYRGEDRTTGARLPDLGSEPDYPPF